MNKPRSRKNFGVLSPSDPRDHDHGDHGHDHDHRAGLWPKIAEALHLPGHSHSHAPAQQSDPLFTSQLGIRALWWSLFLLGATTVFQLLIYLASGSVALLADTVHNLGDTLNSIPLLISLYLGRRLATKRYTHGFGRAEDVAGLFIVASIAFSAGYILLESVQRLLNPLPIANVGWVAFAAIIGFLGNEAVATLEITVGRRIGSEAMVIDGKHARIDGITSLAVLPPVAGSLLGLPILDPIFAVLIGIAILFITRDAVVAMWYRLMDAVDPALTDKVSGILLAHKQVSGVAGLRLRWVGHSLAIEADLQLGQGLSLEDAANVLEDLKTQLRRTVPNSGTILLGIASGGS
jgi:cation diffusion facilitator family transporter